MTERQLTPADFPIRVKRGLSVRFDSPDGDPVNVRLPGSNVVHRADQGWHDIADQFHFRTLCGLRKQPWQVLRLDSDVTCKRCTGQAWMNGAAA